MGLLNPGTAAAPWGNGAAIPADGYQYLSIEGNSHLGATETISQTFDTTLGNTYQITFDWAVLLGGGAGTYDLTYKIGAASAVTLPLTVAAGGGASLTAWDPITSASFIAGSSTSLTFWGTDTTGATGYYGTVLDNVLLNDITPPPPPPPVPEPATFALLLVGGGLMVWRRARK